jgi:hypothetical protein
MVEDCEWETRHKLTLRSLHVRHPPMTLDVDVRRRLPGGEMTGLMTVTPAEPALMTASAPAAAFGENGDSDDGTGGRAEDSEGGGAGGECCCWGPSGWCSMCVLGDEAETIWVAERASEFTSRVTK